MCNMRLLVPCLLLFQVQCSRMPAQTVRPISMSDPRPPTNTAAVSKLPDAPLAAGTTPASPTVVQNTVQVNAREQADFTARNSPQPFHATATEILSSAGTFGDMSRYLQLFPGVVSDNDESNDILVRGGNPLENLFLVDGIEVPNINHITEEAGTGGLVSMIDSAALEGVDLRTGGYDASYEERLSSVVDIHTREMRRHTSHTEGDFGFIGAGGVTERPLGDGGSLLLSAHRSLLNLFTNDIGLNGVPIYSNALVRAKWKPEPADEVTILSLGGLDSIDITPAAIDPAETSTIQVQYGGYRATAGVRWQHIFSPDAFGVLTVSDTEQQERVNEQDQFFDGPSTQARSLKSDVLTPVYFERTHDGTTALRYDGFFSAGSKLTMISGVALHEFRIDYDIAQPKGEQSVLSIDPAPRDADSFSPDFSTGELGAYAEGTWKVAERWSVSGGARAQIFQFGGYTSVTPRVSSSWRFAAHAGMHASFGEYAQMPPFVYLTAWPQNYTLHPIRARHFIAGIDLYEGSRGRLGIEAYRKSYRDYPVSTEYPTLSLANLVDTLGQQFLWLPMTSRGTGLAQGVELFGETHMGDRLLLQGNIAYGRAEYAGLDGILRPGNFDFPVVMNVAGNYRFSQYYGSSWRYEYSSGRPYTPYLLQISEAQNRPVYDVSKINESRGPFYSRFDFQFERKFFLGSRQLITYVGLQNAFDRENFLGYFWMPRLTYLRNSPCKVNPGACLSAQYQMKRFPSFGVRYVF